MGRSVSWWFETSLSVIGFPPLFRSTTTGTYIIPVCNSSSRQNCVLLSFSIYNFFTSTAIGEQIAIHCGMPSPSPHDESDFTLAQQVAITLVPAFTGTLSILGSGCIICMLLAKNREKLKSVKYRFLFALCCCDIWNSLVFVFWSLPIPEGTPGVWGAMGNKASCDAQGVFFQFSIMGSYYNWPCTTISRYVLV
jgi:hypothetical protein